MIQKGMLAKNKLERTPLEAIPHFMPCIYFSIDDRQDIIGNT
jgi:hypothetical protein